MWKENDVSPEQKRQFDLSHATVNFRWILPIMLGGYIVAWSIQQNWQNQRFDNLQKGQDAATEQIRFVYGKIDLLQAKEVNDFDYVLQHFVLTK